MIPRKSLEEVEEGFAHVTKRCEIFTVYKDELRALASRFRDGHKFCETTGTSVVVACC